jgi:hypothetical protein
VADDDWRGTYWTRYPDPDAGPLWVGQHWNRRGGRSALVGLEVWTEPPGDARRSLGPPSEPGDDLSPAPPRAVTGAILRSLRLVDLIRRFRASLEPSLAASVTPPGPGRPRTSDEAHLERVAGSWRRATSARLPVGPAVARQFGVSLERAYDLIGDARRAGLIPG